MSEFECWTTKMEQVMNMEVVEMGMSRWTYSRTLLDKISNTVIKNLLRIMLIIEKVIENIFRFYRQVQRRLPKDEKKIMSVDDTIRKRRPWRKWEHNELDIKELSIFKYTTSDWMIWISGVEKADVPYIYLVLCSVCIVASLHYFIFFFVSICVIPICL